MIPTSYDQTPAPQSISGRKLRGYGSLVTPGVGGSRIFIQGTVRSGSGAPVDGALMQICQRDPAGRLQEGRLHTQPDGSFLIETVKPLGRGEGGRFDTPYVLLSITCPNSSEQHIKLIDFENENGTDTPVTVDRRRRRVERARRVEGARYVVDVDLQDGDVLCF